MCWNDKSVNIGVPCLSGHSLSAELGDSMTSTVTRLEMDKEELQLEVDSLRERLSTTQTENGRLKKEADKEVARRISELEHHTQELRLQTSKELSSEYQKEYEKKVASLEEQGAELKHKISQEFAQKMSALEQQKRNAIDECSRKMAAADRQKREFGSQVEEYKKQLMVLQEAYTRDKDQARHMEKLNQDLSIEKEQFKQRLQALQENSAGRIQQLELEVESARARSARIQQHNNKINNLCDPEINRDNAQYVAMRAANGHVGMERCPVGERRGPRGGSRPTSATSSPMMRDHNQNLRRSASMRVPPGHRPATVSSDPRARPTTVVTPQRRPLDSSRESVQSQRDIVRKGRRSSTSSQSSQISTSTMTENTPFIRSDKFRSTMPERKTVYVAPERRPVPRRGSETDNLKEGTSKSGYTIIEEPQTPRNGSYPSVNDCKPQGQGRAGNQTDSGKIREAQSEGDKDSGRATSPDSPNSTGDQEDKESPRTRQHRLTSMEIISSETIRKSFRSVTKSGGPKINDRWMALVDKIVELQDKNQELIVDNSELKRTVNTSGFSSRRLDAIEKRNILLEVENRKLRQICETLQYALSGQNPYDKRIYHYLSNV